MLLALLPFAAGAAAAQARRGTVSVDTSRRLATFEPARAWGAALDGHDADEIAGIYTPANITAMNSAGFGPVSYRLRTELAIEAWHWNPEGSWSDSLHRQGYWTSSDRASRPIERSFGYRLPRRGRTVDDADNDGYSRIDDGDTASFWKSNPYLDPRFTGASEADNPQWVVVDLGAPRAVSAVRLAWGEPHARRYALDFWQGNQSVPIDRNPPGHWERFPSGTRSQGRGGNVLLALAPRAIRTRFVRLTMTESSHTAPAGASDPRDSVGFALREMFVGTLDRRGRLIDVLRHGQRVGDQGEVLVSSTDPWHRESDRDTTSAQPGFDLVFGSGLTHGLPVLVPVAVLFDTPANALAELRYLRARGWPVPRLELGEEPDGQRVSPEDYAALYLQFARALRAEDSSVTLGGPSWQNLLDVPAALGPVREENAHASWISRFLAALRAARAPARAFGFLSFEWYPFDDPCAPTGPSLARARDVLSRALDGLKESGLPDSIPRILTEYGYSAHSGPAEVDIASALLNADVLAGFMAKGGSEAYVYGWEPGWLGTWKGCGEDGNNLLFLANDEGGVRFRMPAYYAGRLLTRAWADSSGGAHGMFAARLSPARGVTGAGLVSAWALSRPDGRWAFLLINRDPEHAWDVEARVGEGTSARALAGPLDVWRYSRAQYEWSGRGEHGRPVRDDPPTHRVLAVAPGSYLLPPYSITVLVGR
ncbi:MAG: discoidin domain-containing protein [Gemmatimonadales bacterium]